MKTNKLLILVLVMAFILSACGAGAVNQMDSAAVLDVAYTVAAMTLSAHVAAVTPTLMPASTAVPFTASTPLTTNVLSRNILTPATVVNAVNACDNSVYLSDVTIPDGTIFAPGTSFTKTWSLQNAGSCTWDTSYRIAFFSGSDMSGSATALISTVSSGGQTSASVAMTAPSIAGTYTGYWRLQNAAGASFGQSVYVQIVVSSSTAIITSTATDIPYVNTSTPTSQSVPTSVPTDIPTDTPTDIPTSVPEPTSASDS